MSSKWTQTTIGELVASGEANIQTGPFGSQLHKHDYVDNGVPVIPTEAIGRGRILDIEVPKVSTIKANELSRHCLKLGDILFARRGAQATGLSAIVDERYEGGLCGTGALLLRLNSTKVLSHYLSVYLSSEAAFQWLRTRAVGAVMPNLNTEIIKALPLKLPGISEQRELSIFVGALDERIALLRETNATLEAIAQALFKSWFVDFDPVHAKAQGIAPEGMDEATAALFPDSFEESELGLVPKGWINGVVGDIATIKGGKQLDKEAFDKNGVNPVFGGAGVMGHSNMSNATGFVITVGRVGAYCGQFFWRIGDAWVNNNASNIQPNKARDAAWLYQWLRNVNMDIIKKGAAQPFVSNGDVAQLKMVTPPEKTRNYY